MCCPLLWLAHVSVERFVNTKVFCNVILNRLLGGSADQGGEAVASRATTKLFPFSLLIYEWFFCRLNAVSFLLQLSESTSLENKSKYLSIPELI